MQIKSNIDFQPFKRKIILTNRLQRPQNPLTESLTALIHHFQYTKLNIYQPVQNKIKPYNLSLK